MSTDIQILAERKIHGIWTSIQSIHWVKDFEGDDEEEAYPEVPDEDKLYIGQNYNLYGLLAGVRDKWDNQFFEAKGFPQDASDDISAYYEYYEEDVYSPSYLTLKELRSLDWDRHRMMVGGMMKRAQWERLKRTLDEKRPDWNLLYPYSAWSNEKTKDVVKFKLRAPVKVICNDFYPHVIQRLDELKGDCADDEIRIVFWFIG